MKYRFLHITALLPVLLLCFSCIGPKQGKSQEAAGESTVLERPARTFAPGEEVPEDFLAEVVVDSFFSVKPVPDEVFSRMDGVSFKDGCPVSWEDLRYIRVLHRDASGVARVGEMVANKSISGDLLEIFRALFDASYPIEKMLLIDDYGGDDSASMADNNSSCFNFRPKTRMSGLSKHASGEAVDINPLYNPYTRLRQDGSRIVEPVEGKAYLDRDSSFDYKIERGDLCHRLFIAKGFSWGGSWNRSKDYQHFEKL